MRGDPYACAFVDVYVCISMNQTGETSTNLDRVCVYACVYVCAYMHVCVCASTYECMYAHVATARSVSESEVRIAVRRKERP